ncbi:MAG: formate/nitrite transporter family protein [Coriobacteriia bacterium]|nr:formate/nitrite transporter family protein [Coriobacteriia bacterium]
MDEKTIAALKTDALVPAEIAQKFEATGVAKTSMNWAKVIVLGILAGTFIGMGGMMLGLVLSDTTLPFIAQRLIGGLSFCIGLVLVVVAGAELFTGNVLIIMSTLSGKVSWGAFALNLLVIWTTNLIGSLLAVAIVFYANVGAMNGGAVADAFINLAAMKVSIPPAAMFFKAILCNFLVCLAVWMAAAGRTLVDKFVIVLFPISAFVAAGGEHSVANMFFLPMGFFQALAGNATGEAALAAANTIDLAGIAANLGIVTLGNIVGGMILVGCLYWIAFSKKSKKA